MVDVDRRMSGLNPAHIAGLRRLSARAAPTTPLPPRTALLSLPSLASSLLSRLRSAGIHILPGLSDAEFAKAEADFGFSFPPDLKAVLQAGLPLGPGFPDWRSAGARVHLRQRIDLPIAAISFQIAKNALWCRSWGLRPDNPEKALRIARVQLKKAPLLIPVFNHCYIPCNPCLAGNPVFYVDENRIFCCGSDLSDFFVKESFLDTRSDPEVLLKQRSMSEKSAGSSSSSSSSSGSGFLRRSLDSNPGQRTPRWVEFWSDAAVDRRKRNSNSSFSSCSSPEGFFEMPRSEIPKWVEDYITKIGSVLKEGGWAESDVAEIVHVSASGFFDEEMVLLDNQAVLDALLLKTGRFSDILRKSGWSSEEVSEVFGFEFRVPEKERKPVKKLSSELVERIGKLAESVSRSQRLV